MFNGLDDPEFLASSEELVNFYRANPEIAAGDLLNVDLSDVQKVILRAMWFKNYVISIMCRGSGKCVSGDTYLFTNQGLKQIREVSNELQILNDTSLSISNGQSIFTAHKVYYDGIKPTNHFLTRCGFSIAATDDHPLLTMSTDGNLEWKPSHHIQPGDFLVLERGANVWGNSKLDPEYAYLLGLLIGDGCLSRDNVIKFTNKDPHLIHTFIELSTKFFNYTPHVAKYKNRTQGCIIYSKSIRKNILDEGLEISLAPKKKVPDIILSSSRASWVAFLQGLFDTDGWFFKGKNEVGFCSSSEALTEVVHLALLNLGIVGKKRFKINKKASAFLIEIHGEEVEKFATTVGFRCFRKQKLLNDYLKTRPNFNTNLDLIPNQNLRFRRIFEKAQEEKINTCLTTRRKLSHYSNYYAPSYSKTEALLSELPFQTEDTVFLQTLIKKNYVFDEVKDKTYRAEKVYDLVMPEESQHAFVGNGFINHNTYLNAVFACLKGMLYPGYRIGLLAPTFRQCVTGDTLIYTDKGLQYVDEIKDLPNKIFSHEGPASCSHIFTNPAERTIKIKTKLGFQLEGASDHKILVLDTKANFVYKELSAIKTNDEICIHKGSQIFGNHTNLDKFISHISFPGNTRDCYIPNELDVELSYFLGLLTGDGCLTEENTIRFTNTDPGLLQEYTKQCLRFFRKVPYCEQRNNVKHLVQGSKKFFLFLTMLGLGRKSALEKSVPSIVLQSNMENVCAYLQGLFDTDGGVYYYPNSHPCKLGFYTTSKKLSYEVKTLLLNLGIISSTNIQTSNRNTPLYSLEISDKNSFFLFSNFIGFRHKAKREILDKCLKYFSSTDLRRRHSHGIRNINPLAEELCRELRRNKKGFGHLNLCKHFTKEGKVKSRHRLTMPFLQKLIVHCRREKIRIDVLGQMENIIKKDLLFDTIVSKEYGFSYTYDFTVDLTHNYLSNGLVSHNSKMIFDECNRIWQKAPIFQNATERRPTQQSDNCYIRFKSAGGRSGSLIQGLPLGDGCLTNGLIVLQDRLCYIQDLLPLGYKINTENYLDKHKVLTEAHCFSPIEYVWSNGETPVLKITTEQGYSIEGTYNHPIRILSNGQIVWRKLETLRDNEWVVLDRNSTWHTGISDIAQEEAYVAGVLLGDGSSKNKYKICLATNDYEIQQRVDNYFFRKYNKHFVQTDSQHFSLNSKSIRQDFLTRLGIEGHLLTKEKEFPKSILKSEKYKVVSFLQGLFDTDGGFQTSGNKLKKGGCVSFYNTSGLLVQQIQEILLLFGITSTVSSRKRNPRWEKCYQLMITGKDVLYFYKEIGFGLTRKQNSLENFVTSKQRWTSLSDVIPGSHFSLLEIIKDYKLRGLGSFGFTESKLKRVKKGISASRLRKFVDFCCRLKITDSRLDELDFLSRQPYYFSKIVDIQKGLAETFDIHVPGKHTFWSNGFISHNTKIRGSRFFTIICDEFPHIPEDIFNMVIRPMAATVSDPMENVRRLSRQKELLDKGLITEDELDEKAANQIIITSSGYFTFNHMYKLYSMYREEMYKGSDRYAVFRVPYTLLPEGFLDQDSITAAKNQMSNLEFQMEYMAAFIPDTDAFYKASLLEACSQTNFYPQVVGSPNKSYCLGVDPARTEDSFAICIMELSRPAKVVHAIELKKQPFPKMAALIEELCATFNVELVYMDAGGGGLAIKDILAENARNDSGGPILDAMDEIHLMKRGRHILRMCNFTSDFISESNFAALRLLEHRDLLFPTLPRESEPSASVEESWDAIQSMKQQMQMIELSETVTGKHHFNVPKGEGHGRQKKDLYSAFMLAARAVYDHLWSDQMPESNLHQVGIVHERSGGKVSPITFVGDPSLGHSALDLPQALQDKLEIAQDPEAFRKKMLTQSQVKRNVLTSPAAVLKPKPKKPSR